MGYGKGSVRRHLRRSLRKGPGGLMFNRHPYTEFLTVPALRPCFDVQGVDPSGPAQSERCQDGVHDP